MMRARFEPEIREKIAKEIEAQINRDDHKFAEGNSPWNLQERSREGRSDQRNV
jgi:hypothetical protein